MNKQELIEKYEKLKGVCKDPGAEIARLIFLEDLRELDEPQKVTVPQFVADYIDFKKKYDFHVYGTMREIENHYDKRVQEWFYEGNVETFARAWLDGYEVEKEKRYLVKAKGVHLNSCLVFEKKNKKWFFSSIYEIDHQRGYHTRKELEEADFGWMFDCPGIEIEEVKG